MCGPAFGSTPDKFNGFRMIGRVRAAQLSVLELPDHSTFTYLASQQASRAEKTSLGIVQSAALEYLDILPFRLFPSTEAHSSYIDMMKNGRKYRERLYAPTHYRY